MLCASPEVLSSCVGELQEDTGCCVMSRCFECFLDGVDDNKDGGTPFTTPGHGIATDTSLHEKCSCAVVEIKFFFASS